MTESERLHKNVLEAITILENRGHADLAEELEDREREVL